MSTCRMNHTERRTGLIAAVAALGLLGIYLTNCFGILGHAEHPIFPGDGKRPDLCPQPGKLVPPASHVANASIFLNDEYKARSFELLGGAVRIPTVSYDDLADDPREDQRLNVFSELHAFLEHSFPLVSKHLEYINTYGLLYTINGSDPSLKPLLLMAHQDVVPVEESTAKDWQHPPFSGYFDGTRIWGRGSDDTKNSLVAILEAAEKLLEQHFDFSRTVVISFGFDEEVDGSRGAGKLADTLRSRYGHSDSLYMIIDEGSTVMATNGPAMGVVGVSEKGYTDIELKLNTPGGHSSSPPDHTGIGIMSALIAQLEQAHLVNTRYRVKPDDVVASFFQCKATYDADVDEETFERYTNAKKLRDMLKDNVGTRGLISTTQAVDVINGGVKINALPEQVRALVNYRIDVHESVGSVTNATVGVISDVISTGRYGDIGLKLNGNTLIESASKSFLEVNNGQSIEPAPTSPYTNDDDHWKLLAGTSMRVLQDWFDVDYVATVPLAMTGNTDTYQYAGMTNNVYRYTVGLPDSGTNAHTVNEWILAESHLATVVWYYELLQFM